MDIQELSTDGCFAEFRERFNSSTVRPWAVLFVGYFWNSSIGDDAS